MNNLENDLKRLEAEIKEMGAKGDLTQLPDYPVQWIYDSLSKICIRNNKEVTVENMMLYAAIIDGDLERDFRNVD